jgi:hypothetical protein
MRGWGRKYVTVCFIICNRQKILLDSSDQGRRHRRVYQKCNLEKRREEKRREEKRREEKRREEKRRGTFDFQHFRDVSVIVHV